jgi:hypothetical protein
MGGFNLGSTRVWSVSRSSEALIHILLLFGLNAYHPRTAEASGIFTTTGRILILQQLERKLWKIADAFFRIS